MHSDTPELLRFNICGRRFEIRKSTASRYADSIFGLLASETAEGREHLLRSKGIFRRSSPVEPSVDEWYAERSSAAFGLIADYVCTGRLHCPPSVCKELLKSELVFWRLYDAPLPDCCWGDEDEDFDAQSRLEERGKSKKTVPPRALDTSRRSRYAEKIKIASRRLVGKPASSKAATVFSSLSVFFIALAVLNLIISTLPSLQVCRGPADFSHRAPNDTSIPDSDGSAAEKASVSGDASNGTEVLERRKRFDTPKYRENCEGGVVFQIVEAICVGWFTFEWLLRFGCASSKRAFVKSPLNVTDLLAIAPFYVDVVVWLVDAETSRRHRGAQSLLQILRLFRIFRLFNVVRLARYSESLKIMGASLWRSRSEFGVLVVFIGFTTTIFSSVVYFCEKDSEDTDFTSIPAAFWWAVVTVTTVGYGDVTPKSTFGKLFAAVCCVVGIVIVAFPVSILVEHFHRLYRSRAKKAPMHRIAVMITPNEIGVVQMRKPANRKKIPAYEVTSKL